MSTVTALQWASGRIKIDGVDETTVDGQYATNARWNGWLVVRLTIDNAVKVLEALEIPHEVHSDPVCLRIWEEGADEHEDLWPDHPTGLVHLGSYAWVWSLADS